jgi:hypothetical protein
LIVLSHEGAVVREQRVGEFMEYCKALPLNHFPSCKLDEGSAIAPHEDSSVAANIVGHFLAPDPENARELLGAVWRPAPAFQFGVSDLPPGKIADYDLRIRLTRMGVE